MFELSYYPVINPQLSIEFVFLLFLLCRRLFCCHYSTVWALLLFVRKSVYINPAHIDPRLLEARSPHYIKDGPKKRYVSILHVKIC
jgi:hypothetical protein